MKIRDQQVEVVAVAVSAINVMKKVIWQEIVQILTPDVVVEEEVEAVPATNAIKKDTWHEIALMVTEVAWTKVPTKDKEEMTTMVLPMLVVETGAVVMLELETGDQPVVQPVAGVTTIEGQKFFHCLFCRMQFINLTR